MKVSKQFIGTSAILFATMMWGTTFALIKDAVASITPFDFLFWRFSIATLLLFILFFKYLEFENKFLILKGILLGLCLGGTVIFQTIGLCYTTASTASFITGLSVIFVALFVYFAARKCPTLNIFLALIFAIIGFGLITWSKGMVLNQGDLWVLLCAFCFAIYIVLAGKFSQENKTISLTFIQLATITILTGLFCILMDGKIIFPAKSNVWLAIVFCSLFASVIAFTLQLRYQRYISPIKTAIIFATEPVFATIVAILYLNEHLTLGFTFGAFFIFLGIFLSESRLLPFFANVKNNFGKKYLDKVI